MESIQNYCSSFQLELKNQNSCQLIAYQLEQVELIINQAYNRTINQHDLGSLKDKLNELYLILMDNPQVQSLNSNLRLRFLQNLLQLQQLEIRVSKAEELRLQEMSDLSNHINEVIKFLTSISIMYQRVLMQKELELAKEDKKPATVNCINWQDNLVFYLAEINKTNPKYCKYKTKTIPNSNNWLLILNATQVPQWVKIHLAPGLQTSVDDLAIDIYSINKMTTNLIEKIGAVLQLDLSKQVKSYLDGCSNNISLSLILDFLKIQLQEVDNALIEAKTKLNHYYQDIDNIEKQLKKVMQVINPVVI